MNSTIPQVAVLLATYNGAKHLQQQMDSILQQENVAVRIFVRDDGSTDHTLQIIRDYALTTGKVLLMDPYPVKLMAAKNFMSLVKDIDLSGMDYVAYCDQDDIWLPQKLNAAIMAMEQNHADCYASNLMMGDQDAKVVDKISFYSRIARYVFNYKSNTPTAYDHYFEAASAGCTLLLSRNAAGWLQNLLTEVFDRIPFDVSHDWSTYAICRIKGFRWYIDSRSYIIYRQHANNVYGANLGTAAISKLLDMFRSGWYRNSILMIDELYNTGETHPPFISYLKKYRHSSIVSRFRLAFSVYPYRRKKIHRMMLFLLIIGGYFK